MKKLFLTSFAKNTLYKLPAQMEIEPRESKVAFIANASDIYEHPDWVKEDREELLRLGFRVTNIDLRKFHAQELHDELMKYDAIFVAGGNSFYFLKIAHESGFANIIQSLVEEERKIYIGSSAGSIVAGPNLLPIKQLESRADEFKLRSYRGLSLVNFIVLPHFGKEKFKPRYEKLIDEAYKYPIPYIIINDNQAIAVKGNSITIV